MNPYWTAPCILKEASAGTTTHTIQDELFQNREIECTGEVTSGLALYDIMKLLKCPIRTVCTGITSMGALLFICGNQRDMLPRARVMIHDPAIAGSIGGNALKIESISKNLMNTRNITAGIIAEHTGKKLEEVLEKTATDSFFSESEAVEYGLADRIVYEI